MTKVTMDHNLRTMRECRRLCGLDYSVGATKRAVYVDAELTPTELRGFQKELFKQVGDVYEEIVSDAMGGY